mmetsp:Transcript_7821/g.13504  ORF Transcript_7821/g.13504 Transcript_7821/m.13504 type:complete len:157 (+) Transcript_7821:263-733(+)
MGATLVRLTMVMLQMALVIVSGTMGLVIPDMGEIRNATVLDVSVLLMAACTLVNSSTGIVMGKAVFGLHNNMVVIIIVANSTGGSFMDMVDWNGVMAPTMTESGTMAIVVDRANTIPTTIPPKGDHPPLGVFLVTLTTTNVKSTTFCWIPFALWCD